MSNTIGLEEAIANLAFEGTLKQSKAYGNGHINDTYLLEYEQKDGSQLRYILQRINQDVFKKPREVMENVDAVTQFIGEKVKANGGDPMRETLNIIKTHDGDVVFKDSLEDYWRGYYYITNSLGLEIVEEPAHFYESALSFGKFQAQLSDFPAATLHATIEDFHNTPKRFEAFKVALEEDALDRAQHIQEEIDFVLEREAFMHTLQDLHFNGELPLKVTHNDTKLNNVLFDKDTEKGLCVIDLDTVMPGFSLDDFGDSIRFGATTGAEDEKDLSKVNFSLELYDLYTKGFLEGADGSLSELEVSLFPEGAKMMTLECGIRFLTDYLKGDVYFKTAYDDHNLVRTRTQFKLVSDMETQWDDMKAVAKKYI